VGLLCSRIREHTSHEELPSETFMVYRNTSDLQGGSSEQQHQETEVHSIHYSEVQNIRRNQKHPD